MVAYRLDGRAAADRLLQRLRKNLQRRSRPVTLATILVGRRFDSALYVKLKRSAAARVGIRTEAHQLPATVSIKKLLGLIQSLNRRAAINGILLQLPLPSHLHPDLAVAVIDPKKDVDGFHPKNRRVQPPPVAAVLHLLRLAKPRRGDRVVLLGKDSVFNQQLRRVLTKRGFHVTIAAAGRSIPPVTKSAGIIITALGRGPQLEAKNIKRGTIIIDVGTRRHGKKVIGDALPSVWTKAKAVSPVPGGVGPLTVAYLLYNTVRLTIPS